MTNRPGPFTTPYFYRCERCAHVANLWLDLPRQCPACGSDYVAVVREEVGPMTSDTLTNLVAAFFVDPSAPGVGVLADAYEEAGDARATALRGMVPEIAWLLSGGEFFAGDDAVLSRQPGGRWAWIVSNATRGERMGLEPTRELAQDAAEKRLWEWKRHGLKWPPAVVVMALAELADRVRLALTEPCGRCADDGLSADCFSCFGRGWVLRAPLVHDTEATIS